MMNLGRNINIKHHVGYFAAGQTAKSTGVLDMTGYEGVLFIAQFGTILENGTLLLAASQDTAVGMGSAATLAGTSAYTVTAADALVNPTCIWLDLYRPQERYVKATITPAVANAVLLGITSIQYSGRKLPITPDDNVLQYTVLASPDEA